MECEMCGKTTGTRRYSVSGTIMRLGLCCAKYGEELDAPAPAQGSQAAIQRGLERRASRNQAPRVQEPEWDLVDDFGHRVRQARERKNMTKEQLGNKVSARMPQLNAIESGNLRPSDDLARRLERALGITLLEAYDKGPGQKLSGLAKTPAKARTIGDLLKEAMDKKGD